MIEDQRQSFLDELKDVKDMASLSSLKAKYLGKKGIVSLALKQLGSLPPEKRPKLGQQINSTREFIEAKLREQEELLKTQELKHKLTKEYIDITLDGKFVPAGASHPLSQVLSEIIDIFVSMGFSIEEGPEVELDYYNFEALNFPKDHPARDMQDTFFVDDNVLLRTHTSPIQVRGMERTKPPVRFIAFGKVYRCDADVTHSPMFHQVEGLVVDEAISFANLKAILEVFIHCMFGSDIPLRLRPSFFPFTEPSAEVDMGCIFCKGKGCRICKNTGWLEILGAGMVNPNVFKYVGYDTEKYSGFAFGMGVERIALLKYGIDDIRLFYENDIRFLGQFV